MSPWDWCALTLITLVVVAGVLVLVYWALRAINISIRKNAPAQAGDDDSSRAADRMIVLSQLWLGVGLVVFGATVAVLFGVVFSDRDIDKVALSIGTAVIGTGAALLPGGASASASSRINTSIQKQAAAGGNGAGGNGAGGNGAGGNGAGGNGNGGGDAQSGTPSDAAGVGASGTGAADSTTTTTTTTTTATDTSTAGDGDTPPSDIDLPATDADASPSDLDLPATDPGAPPSDVAEPADATVPGDTTVADEAQPPAGEGDPKK